MDENMKMEARGKSLSNLMGVMEEDDAKSIPTLMLKISAGPEGIEIEKVSGEGEVEDESTENESENGMESEVESPDGEPKNGFEMLIARKKRGE